MSPAYRTPEQLERWHKRTCARCDRFGFFAAVWPDGPICRTCECRALRVDGRCPECGEHRILPCLRPADAVAICTGCTGCAGFRPSYACSRCGQESQLRAGRLCIRCTCPTGSPSCWTTAPARFGPSCFRCTRRSSR